MELINVNFNFNFNMSSGSGSGCEFESEEEEDVPYATAPHDVVEHHPILGNFIAAKKGQKLLYITKYKNKAPSDKWFSFTVNTDLSVILRKQIIKAKATIGEGEVTPEQSGQHLRDELLGDVTIVTDVTIDPQTQEVNILTLGPSTSKNNQMGEPHDEIMKGVFGNVANHQPLQLQGQPNFVQSPFPTSKNNHIKQFITYLTDNFQETVINGLQFGLRDKVREKLTDKKVLTEQENLAVLHSVNEHIHEYNSQVTVGGHRPNSEVFRLVGDLLKNKFPTSYGILTAVKTPYGTLFIPNKRGFILLLLNAIFHKLPH